MLILQVSLRKSRGGLGGAEVLEQALLGLAVPGATQRAVSRPAGKWSGSSGPGQSRTVPRYLLSHRCWRVGGSRMALRYGPAGRVPEGALVGRGTARGVTVSDCEDADGEAGLT